MKTIAGACSVLSAVVCMEVCHANPVLWYHFDEQQPDVVTSNGRSTVTNAVDSTSLVGTCHSFWENLVMFTNEMPPVYADSFSNGVMWYDPVSKTRGTDGSAMRFRCSNMTSASGHRSVVVVHDATAVQLKTFTVEMFFRDVTGGVTTSERALATFESTVNPDNTLPLGNQNHKNGRIAWRLYVDGNGSLYAYFGGLSATYAQTVGSSNVKILKDGNWHHVAMSVNNEHKEVKLYIDYKEVASSTLLSEIPYESPYLFVGSDMGTIRSSNAVLDEFRISDVALLPNEMIRPVTANSDADTLLYLSFDDWFGGKTWSDVTGYPACYLNEAAGAKVLRVQKMKLGGETSVYDADVKPVDVVRDGISGRTSVSDVSSIELKYDSSKNLGTCFRYDDIARDIMSSSFTAEFFFKADTLPPYQYGTYFLSETAGQSESWYVNMGHGDGKLAAGVRNASGVGGTRTIVTPKSYADGKWHHIAFVWDKPSQMVLFYVDYDLMGSLGNVDQVNNAAANEAWKPPYDRYLYIGGRCNGEADQSMHHSGWMDEVRITQRSLDPQEFLTGKLGQGSLLAQVDFEDRIDVLPYADLVPAGVMSGSCAYDGKVPVSEIVENGGSVVEASNAKSLHLQGGKVSFGRNLPVEKAGDYLVEFFMKADSVSRGVQLLGFDGSWSLSCGERDSTLVLTVNTDAALGQTVVFPLNQLNAWFVYALAFSRNGSETAISLYRNGVLIGTKYVAGQLLPSSGMTLGSDGFFGWFDELRVREGSVDLKSMMFCPNPKGLIVVFR